jgi:hypothetical protein
MSKSSLRLVCRMDDAGSCPSANAAIAEVLRTGYARNVSVMACAPDFDEAAAMLREFPEACIGLHMTINAEWDLVKWGPVLPARQVPSLVDEAGMLLPTPMANHQRGVNAGEIMAELAAQLQRMRDTGLTVRYADTHMGFGWLAGLGANLDEFVRREGLLVTDGRVPGLPAVEGRFDDVGDEIVARLSSASAAGLATCCLVGHPGYDRPDMQRMGHAGHAPGQIARERVRERQQFQSPKVAGYARDHGVEFARYTEVL